MPTPLEREILTHYWCFREPYRGGSENWTDLHAEIVRRFLDTGLLIQFKGDDGLMHIKCNEAPVRLYMDALEAVPLPAKYWAIPGTPNCIPLSEKGD